MSMWDDDFNDDLGGSAEPTQSGRAGKAVMRPEGVSREVSKSLAEFIGKVEEDDLPEHLQRSVIVEPPYGKVVFYDMEPGSDKEERERLKKFDSLKYHALPLRRLGGGGYSTQRDQRAQMSQLTQLSQRAPWLEPAIKQVQKNLRLNVHRADGAYRLSQPLLLVGPPGMGKTWLCNQLAQVLGLPVLHISGAGRADNMSLKGTSRGWGTARPGELVNFIADKKCANPLVIVDELDKVSHEKRNGSFFDTLLQLFEAENAQHWQDEYLQGRVDLSAVSWLATANDSETIPQPLRSRMNIIHLHGPRNAEESRLLLRSLAWDIAAQHG